MRFFLHLHVQIRGYSDDCMQEKFCLKRKVQVANVVLTVAKIRNIIMHFGRRNGM